MAEHLKCLHCGVRRLVTLTALTTEGVEDMELDVVVKCPCCDRFYKIKTNGVRCHLELVSTTSAMVALRTL